MQEGISLVVSCYNDGSLLGSFLESVLEQEQINFSFELIVIDNASTDNTADVFKSYVKDFSIKHLNYYYYLENKRGLNHARNRGLHESHYSYIGFTDADAKLNKKYLIHLKKLIDENNPIILCGSYKPWYNTSKPKWFKDSYNEKNHGDKSRYLNKGEFPSGINMIYNKDILNKFNGFGTEIVYKGNNDRGEETELFYRYEKHGYADYIFYSPMLLVYHYTRPQMMSLLVRLKSSWGVGKNQAKYKSNPGIIQNIKDIFWIIKELLKDTTIYLFKKNNSSKIYFQNFIAENIAPRVFDLSLSIHFIKNRF